MEVSKFNESQSQFPFKVSRNDVTMGHTQSDTNLMNSRHCIIGDSCYAYSVLHSTVSVNFQLFALDRLANIIIKIVEGQKWQLPGPVHEHHYRYSDGTRNLELCFHR